MSEDVTVFEYDGRAYLQAVDKKYDVILLDAYQDITIPFQMSSVEFFQMVKDHLTDNGIIAVNMNMHSDGEGAINEYLTNTIMQVFPYASSIDVPANSNRELFASANEDPAALLAASDKGEYDPALRVRLGAIQNGLTACSVSDKSRILTDDKAPVELLGMSMIDSLIQEELSYYQNIYKTRGIRALIESLL